MRRTKVEPPTAGQGPAGATRKRALPAAPPAEASDEQQLSAKQARRLKDHYTHTLTSRANAHLPRSESMGYSVHGPPHQTPPLPINPS